METYRELDTVVLLYMLIFLVADCVCGVVGTSFLVVVDILVLGVCTKYT